MKSSVNSTKSELLEQLLNSVDEEFGGVKLPPEKRNFILWNEDDEVAQEKVEKREAELMEKFGTLEVSIRAKSSSFDLIKRLSAYL